MGYAPGDGDSFVNSGNGIWWACAPADLTGQTQHIKGGVAQGDEDPKAYFTVDYKAGTITSYNGQGQQIRSGAYTISNWNMGKRTNASIDGSQANWSLGTLNTNAILFPWMINGGGTQVNLGLEIMQLDGNHIKKILQGSFPRKTSARKFNNAAYLLSGCAHCRNPFKYRKNLLNGSFGLSLYWSRNW